MVLNRRTKLDNYNTMIVLVAVLCYLLFLGYAVWRVEYLAAEPCSLCENRGFVVSEPVRVDRYGGLNVSGFNISEEGKVESGGPGVDLGG